MKSKILTVMILSSLLTILPIFSQESKKYSQIVQNEFGIDLKKSYSGKDVVEIIAICLEEKDVAIETAYEEGYKQAVLEFKPELESYKRKCTLLQHNYDVLKEHYDYKDTANFKNYLTSFTVGFFSGGVLGGVIGYKIDLN